MEFRKDINGLRAFAVIAVMLYHFGIYGFSGGFVGVDIFFVISGFLMTGIIYEECFKGGFSFKKFYASRCRRLVPALAILCLTLLIAGWFWLPPHDYKMLGRHAAAALTFITNFIFKNEAGYFDTFSKDKILLHTWSLSLEWQFYLVYPLLIAAFFRWIKKRKEDAGKETRVAIFWLWGIAIASFGLCAYITPTHSAFAFYLLPSRLWEFLAGGLAYLAFSQGQEPEKLRQLGFISGLLLISLSIFFFDEGIVWPGYWAAIPVLGSILVIWGRQQNSILLNNPVIQKIGIWSYSIYLWHWPVMIAFRLSGFEHSVLADFIGAAFAILLGGASYHFVETPFRRPDAIPLRAGYRRKVITSCFMVALLWGFVIDKKDGFAFRVSEDVLAIERDVRESKHARAPTCSGTPTTFSSFNCEKAAVQPDFVVLGDSHAPAIFNAIHIANGAHKYGRLYHMTCPPFPNAYVTAKDYSRHCPTFYQSTLAEISSLPESVPVFFAFRYAMYLHGPNEHPDLHIGLSFTDETYEKTIEEAFKQRLVTTLCNLSKNGRSVYAVAPVPEIGIDVPNALARHIMFQDAYKDIDLPIDVYKERQKHVLETLQQAATTCPRVKILDPTPYFCSDSRCRGIENKKALYSDDNHLSNHGILRVAPLFKDLLAFGAAGQE